MRGFKSIVIYFLLAVCSASSAQIISRFTWNANPVTTADIGPNATSVSGSAISSTGGVGGTNGLNAGFPTADLNFTIPTGSGIFDVPGIEVSVDYQRDESVGNFFTRGSSLIITGASNLSVSYRVDNGAGGFNTVSSGNVFAIPNDNTFRNYSFYYLPTSGIGVLAVNGATVWTNDGPDNRNMYWTGAGNIVIGSALDGASQNQAFLDNLIIGEVSSTPLPIELLDFSATLQDNRSVTLTWQTASEHNNAYFLVQRSENAVNWEERGKVEGAGNSQEKRNYSFDDEQHFSGTMYYRLQQIDANGAFSFSPIRVVNANTLATSELKMYPNPCNQVITLQGENLDNIGIYNALAQDVTSSCRLLVKTETEMILDISGLTLGVYTIRSNTTSYKLLKQGN